MAGSGGKNVARIKRVAAQIILFSLLVLWTISPLALAQQPEQWSPTLARVVIDPGHGGDDKGVVGPAGWPESELTWTLAIQLKDALEKELGIEVTLSREKDKNPSLVERTTLGNRFKADVFLSIHAGGSLSPEQSGYNVFFQGYGFQAGLGDRVERTDRLPGQTQQWTLAQARHLPEAQKLAQELDQSISEVLRTKSMGPKGIPLVVLAGANQPAVMIEVGKLTNAEEERRLMDQGYREELTRAIVQGFRSWQYWRKWQ